MRARRGLSPPRHRPGPDLQRPYRPPTLAARDPRPHHAAQPQDIVTWRCGTPFGVPQGVLPDAREIIMRLHISLLFVVITTVAAAPADKLPTDDNECTAR